MVEQASRISLGLTSRPVLTACNFDNFDMELKPELLRAIDEYDGKSFDVFI